MLLDGGKTVFIFPFFCFENENENSNIELDFVYFQVFMGEIFVCFASVVGFLEFCAVWEQSYILSQVLGLILTILNMNLMLNVCNQYNSGAHIKSVRQLALHLRYQQNSRAYIRLVRQPVLHPTS